MLLDRPKRVVTDSPSSYPRAISEVLGKAAQHEVSQSPQKSS